MPKYPTKLPKVFLACPFDKDKDRLTAHLNKLPWKVKVADKITSDHLLKKIITEMKSCDFSIFDISGWNPNVCLELGLARGMNEQYYIINNTSSKKKDAPSDIKGIDRIDYDWDRRKNTASLYDKLKDGIFKKKFCTRAIWKKLQHVSNADKKFELALNILHAFKTDRSPLTTEDLKHLAKGLNFKKQDDFDEVINTLVKLKLFGKVQKSGALRRLGKLYQ